MTPGAGDSGPAVALRRMRWWDVPAVLEIERSVFPDPWTAETFWSELAGVPQTRHYLVAVASLHTSEQEVALVGYAGLLATPHRADVQTVAVSPNRQGQRIGARLLDALLTDAAARGAGEVLLEVRSDNGAAQRLYERFGFERVGVRRGYYQPGHIDALVMRRSSVRPP